MNEIFFSILLAFLGYSLLNIGQACQKIGLSVKNSYRKKGWSIWVAATIATFFSVLIVYIAISLGSISIVGALSGSGLVSLTVFSRFVMKEELASKEIIGVMMIIASAITIGSFARNPATASVHYTGLYLYVGISIGFYLVLTLFSLKRPFLGIILGGFSGLLAGFSSVLQKVTTTEAQSIFLHPEGIVKGLFEAIKSPFTVAWVLLSLFSMVVLQFSYSKGKTITIIPTFTAHFIMVPVFGGVIVFAETLTWVQWAGVILMVAGSILVTIKRREQTVQY